MIKPKSPEVSFTDELAIFHRTCQVTHSPYMVEVDYDDYIRWRNGELIQEVFPQLSASQREFMMTGYTPAEWTAIFSTEDR